MKLCALIPVVLLAAASFVRAAEPTNAPATNSIVAPATNAPVVTDTNAASGSATNSTSTSTNKPVRDVAVLEAFHGMQIRRGFRLQLAALSPLVKSPVAMAFDANGRIFVAEQGGNGEPGRIKLLEDPDGDGAFEKFTVFADNVAKPTALICYAGGIFVAAGPQIIFLTDTNNDGVSDMRREIFGGFETTPENNGPGGGINNFTWGLDNRIHAATAGVGGNITCIANPTRQPVSLSGYDFAFDPRTLEMFIESDGINRGVSFDNAGHRYTCNATRPVQATVCDPVRSARNPFFVWPQITADLANGSATGFRLASSLLVYRGGAMPASFVGDAFIADPATGVLRRWHLRENGMVPVLEVQPIEAATDFLSSRELAFRPIQVVSAPDGTLYVADLARKELDQHTDAGRLWRISPPSLKPAVPPKLDALKTPQLVGLLASPNGWMRDTTARLLFERRDTNAVPLLASQLARSRDPIARLQSLHALHGLDALTEKDVLAAMADGDERVREHGARLAAQFIRSGDVSNELWTRLASLTNDRSARVRMELAFAVGNIQRRGASLVLANIARNSINDRAVQFAVLSAARDRAADLLGALIADRRFTATPSGWAFVGELAQMTGAENTGGMDDVLQTIERANLNELDTFTLARRVGEGLAAGGQTFVSAAPDGTWQDFGSEALNQALGTGTTELRAETIRFLGVAGYSDQEIGDWLLAFLVADEPQEVQSAAIQSLARYQNPLITAAFVQRWSQLPQQSQREIITRMLTRFDRTMALLTALEARRIPANALTDVQVDFLRSHRDPNFAARATRIYGPSTQAGRAEQFPMALKLKGSAVRGRNLFTARCAGCHQLNGVGEAFGPDLSGRTSLQRAKLLQSILEPNTEIAPAYQVSVIQRIDSELVFGLVSQSGRDVYVVRQPGRQIFIPRTQVEDKIPQNWSLMPADAAAGLSEADLADLLEFITGGR